MVIPNSIILVGKKEIDDPQYVEVGIVCPSCKCEYLIKMLYEEFSRYYQHGELIQDVFPYMRLEDREVMISGLCPDCQKAIFKEEEDE